MRNGKRKCIKKEGEPKNEPEAHANRRRINGRFAIDWLRLRDNLPKWGPMEIKFKGKKTANSPRRLQFTGGTFSSRIIDNFFKIT